MCTEEKLWLNCLLCQNNVKHRLQDVQVTKCRILKGPRVTFLTYRPLEVEEHPDGRALRDGDGVGT